ncbi:MAG: hypothetical protein JWM64_2542, partial [Frankiales bacterium]|nr:hypothetical protein [Frankiales bacterium]
AAGAPGPRTAVSDGGVDGLFAAARRALADGHDVAAQYDPDYGFPQDLLVRGEGGYELHVRGFVAG